MTIRLGFAVGFGSYGFSVMWQYQNTPAPGYYQCFVNNASLYNAGVLNTGGSAPFTNDWIYAKITNTGGGNAFFEISDLNTGYSDSYNYTGGSISTGLIMIPLVTVTNPESNNKNVEIDYLSIKYKSSRT